MKTSRHILLPLTLAVSLLGLHALTAADNETSPPPRRPGGAGQEAEGAGPRGPRFQEGQFRQGGMQPGGFQPGRGGGGGMPLESILNDEQRDEFGAAMFAQRDKTRELNEKFIKLRREVDEALFSEKLDEELVRRKSKELAEVELERSLIRARAFAKVRASLSEEQLERLKQLRSEMGRGPQQGQGEFRGPPEGRRLGGRRSQGPPDEGGDDVLPPPAPQKRPLPQGR